MTSIPKVVVTANHEGRKVIATKNSPPRKIITLAQDTNITFTKLIAAKCTSFQGIATKRNLAFRDKILLWFKFCH